MSDLWPALISIAFLIVTSGLWLRRRSKKPRPAEAAYVVTISKKSIACQAPSGEKQEVGWADLHQVVIETNALGPFTTDLFWILAGSKESSSIVVIPKGATGESEMIDALGKLPGFNNDAFLEAMGSTTDNRFVCWTKH